LIEGVEAVPNPLSIRFAWGVISATSVNEASEVVVEQIATKRGECVFWVKDGPFDSFLLRLFSEVFGVTGLMARN
jgi:hypothetical protein